MKRILGVLVCVLVALGPTAPADAAGDNTAPSLDSFTQRTATADPGDRVEVAYSASDPSGVASVVFRFTDPLGAERQTTQASGGVAALTVGANWPPGTYRLDAVDVVDTAANRITYLAGGATDRSARTTAPSSHSLDLGVGNFSVVTGAPSPPKPAIRGVLDRAREPTMLWQPVINGYVVQASWRDLQPAAGGAIASPNVIDDAITSVRQLNALKPAGTPRLTLKLRIFAGDEAPEWAKTLDGPSVEVQDPATGVPIHVGRFWTPRFDAAYRDLHTKLASRYDDVPEIRDVVISRCMLGTAEPFLRYQGSESTVANLLAAGFSVDADHACHEQQIDAHRVWSRTTSSLAFNPYTQINADASTKVDEAFTESMMDECRVVLGSRCVLENNSIRDADQGANYPAMYAKIRALGAPIAFQTATSSRIGSLCNTMAWAVGQGAGAVEVPQGYTTDPDVTVSGYAAYDTALEGTLPAGVPTTATSLTATPLAPTSVDLVWQPAAGAACYSVTRDGVALGTTMATAFNDATATARTTHRYTVTPVNAAGDSGPSLAVSVTTPGIGPAATSQITATPVSPVRVDVAWAAVTGAAKYNLYRDGVGLTTVTSTAISDPTVAPATAYGYVVRAVDAAGVEGAPSATATATTPADTTAPSVPAGLKVVSVTASSVTLSWTASTDDVAVAEYRVFRNGAPAGSTAGTTFTVAALTPKTAYQFAVAAADPTGNVSPLSPAVPATTPADTIAPSVPANVRTTSVLSRSVGLAWDASTDNVGVTSYRVVRNGSVIATVTQPSYTDTSVRPGTTYKYSIKALDAARNVSGGSAPLYVKPV